MVFRDVVTAEHRPSDWSSLRQRIRERIARTFGDAPALSDHVAVHDWTPSTTAGLESRSFWFEAVPGCQTHGTMLLPPAGMARTGIGVVCIHGTDHTLAHRNVCSPDEKPDRAYAIELARMGCMTISVDQLGFGDGNRGRPYDEVLAAFSTRHPNWSIDGARLAIQQAAITVLANHSDGRCARFACIGNSLGGRSALMLAAFDERIACAIVSTGISPNLTNVFRSPPGPQALSPLLGAAIAATGRPPYEYQELLSLIAPRVLLAIEPWNDPYNPLGEASVACFDKARHVWALLEAEPACQILYHGYGHDTPHHVREYAYRVILGG